MHCHAESTANGNSATRLQNRIGILFKNYKYVRTGILKTGQVRFRCIDRNCNASIVTNASVDRIDYTNRAFHDHGKHYYHGNVMNRDDGYNFSADSMASGYDGAYDSAGGEPFDCGDDNDTPTMAYGPKEDVGMESGGGNDGEGDEYVVGSRVTSGGPRVGTRDFTTWTGNGVSVTKSVNATAVGDGAVTVSGPSANRGQPPPWVSDNGNSKNIAQAPGRDGNGYVHVTAMTGDQVAETNQTTSAAAATTATVTMIRDTYAIFGEQVAAQIRNLPSPFARLAAQQRIQSILSEMADVNRIPAVFVPFWNNNNTYVLPVQVLAPPPTILDNGNNIYTYYTANAVPATGQPVYNVINAVVQPNGR